MSDKRIELSIPYEATTMLAFSKALKESAGALACPSGQVLKRTETVTAGDMTQTVTTEHVAEFCTKPLGEAHAGKVVAVSTYADIDAFPLVEGGVCEVCGLPQHDTPSGACCVNCHGGAGTVPAVKVISTPSEAVEAFGEGSDLARVAAGFTEGDAAPVVGTCSECGLPQFDTPSGVSCADGHGGAESTDEEPPPPPPPPPPAEEKVPPPPPATTVVLDAAGLPFDARIHGSGRTFYASGANKGNWKTKRSVDPTLVVDVEAELRAALAVPPPTAEQLEELPPTGIVTISDFITACTAKGLPPATVTEAIKKHGIEGVPVLATRPDLIPLVAAELGL